MQGHQRAESGGEGLWPVLQDSECQQGVQENSGLAAEEVAKSPTETLEEAEKATQEAEAVGVQTSVQPHPDGMLEKFSQPVSQLCDAEPMVQ